jgi:uncharacterized protein (TIRG00374 family)
MPKKVQGLKIFKWIMTFAFIAIAIYLIWQGISIYNREIPGLLAAANYEYIPFLLLIQLLGYVCNACVSFFLLRRIHVKASIWTNMKIAIGNELGNNFTPYVGAILASYVSYRKTLKLNTQDSIFMAASWVLLLILNSIALLILSIIFLPQEIISKNLYLILSFLAIALAVLYFLYFLLKNKSKNFKSGLIKFCEIVNKLWNYIFKRELIRIDEYNTIMTEAGDSLAFFLSDKKQVIPPLLFSFLYYISDALILYFSFAAFHYNPQIALMIFGFIMSSTFALFFTSPAPGLSAATNTIAFVILGFPTPVVLFAVLLYKIITSWIWIPFSFFYFLRINTNNNE